MVRTFTSLLCVALLTSCTAMSDGNPVGYAAPLIEPAVIVEESAPDPPVAVGVGVANTIAGGLASPSQTDVQTGNGNFTGQFNSVTGTGGPRVVTGNPINLPQFGAQSGPRAETRAPAQSRRGGVPSSGFSSAGQRSSVLEPEQQIDPCSPPPPSGLNLPIYPQWPPEESSSRVDVGRLIGPRGALSLYDTGQLLRDALSEAGYQQHSFFSVPGGFILVTETERTDAEGRGLSGISRYQKPGEDRTGFLVSIRDLFLERPKTYYRYLAIVVSDTPFCGSRQALEIEEASQRVRLGLSDLSNETREIEFGETYRVTALIYEFMNDGIGYDLKMVAPGRIPPQDHLAITGMDQTIPNIFEQARREAGSADTRPEN